MMSNPITEKIKHISGVTAIDDGVAESIVGGRGFSIRRKSALTGAQLDGDKGQYTPLAGDIAYVEDVGQINLPVTKGHRILFV